MGCDHTLGSYSSGQNCFNPRTRMGCDFPAMPDYVLIFKFQSTHPHGVRLFRRNAFPGRPCFNPRTRMGCDDYVNIFRIRSRCFNPRTRMGCDGHVHPLPPEIVFQSTHPHGVRHFSAPPKKDPLYVSIHAPAWGATWSPSRELSPPVFQSTHPHGVRHPDYCNNPCYNSFNPRTRMGCDNGGCLREFS